MPDLLKILAASLIMPFPICLALWCLGGVAFLSGCRRLAIGLPAGGFMLLLLASWDPVANRLLSPLEERYPPLLDVSQVSDEPLPIVVLGSGWYPSEYRSITSELHHSSLVRLVEGIRLWRQRPEAQLIVSGASRRMSLPPVAEGYAEAAMALGVPEDRLTLLDTPIDTGQEAYAAKSELGEGARLLLVTSASHMPRAMRHFERAGLVPTAVPTQHLLLGRDTGMRHGLLPSASALRKTERAIHEYMGLIVLELEHQ